MQTSFLENIFVYSLLELTQLTLLLLFSRVKFLRATPLMAWLESSVSAVSIFLLLFAEIFDSRRMLGIFLFWLGQIPLSFMWWSTLQWGGSVTMIRVLGSNGLPVDIYEWKQMTSFADEAKDLKKNRIKILKALKLIRFHSEIYQLTTLGRFLSCSFKLLGSQR